MKSAYELAMERLEKERGPSKKLTDPQKAQIAEIEKKYDAQLAETRLAWENKLQAAQSMDEFQAMKAEMAEELRTIEERRDRDKEAVWDEK
jgi:hypothetical protein